jgi:hypothetical protein
MLIDTKPLNLHTIVPEKPESNGFKAAIHAYFNVIQAGAGPKQSGLVPQPTRFNQG